MPRIRLFALCGIAAAALAAAARPLENLAWKLPQTAHLDGDRLVVEVPEEISGIGRERLAQCVAEVDVSDIVEAGMSAEFRVRGFGISEPDYEWNGVKVMLRYPDADHMAQVPDSPRKRALLDGFGRD